MYTFVKLRATFYAKLKDYYNNHINNDLSAFEDIQVPNRSSSWRNNETCSEIQFCVLPKHGINLLERTGHVMHQQVKVFTARYGLGL